MVKVKSLEWQHELGLHSDYTEVGGCVSVWVCVTGAAEEATENAVETVQKFIQKQILRSRDEKPQRRQQRLVRVLVFWTRVRRKAGRNSLKPEPFMSLHSWQSFWLGFFFKTCGFMQLFEARLFVICYIRTPIRTAESSNEISGSGEDTDCALCFVFYFPLTHLHLLPLPILVWHANIEHDQD